MIARLAIAAWFVLLGYAPDGSLQSVSAHSYVSGGEQIVASYRLHARVAQAAVRGPSPPHELTPHGNDRSYLYDYDALNRLTDARLGRLDSENCTGMRVTRSEKKVWNA